MGVDLVGVGMNTVASCGGKVGCSRSGITHSAVVSKGFGENWSLELLEDGIGCHIVESMTGVLLVIELAVRGLDRDVFDQFPG